MTADNQDKRTIMAGTAAVIGILENSGAAGYNKNLTMVNKK